MTTIGSCDLDLHMQELEVSSTDALLNRPRGHRARGLRDDGGHKVIPLHEKAFHIFCLKEFGLKKDTRKSNIITRNKQQTFKE